jgi:hypothetical protein
MPSLLKFERVAYATLNSRQKEIYNFQKVSGLLAEYGFATLRLTDDWSGADFLAVHVNGATILRVQLKGRMTFEHKYTNKDIWICFRHKGVVYLYPHDDLLNVALRKTNIGNTESWNKSGGGYSFPSPPAVLQTDLLAFCLGKETEV